MPASEENEERLNKNISQNFDGGKMHESEF
jgi:hypothetical protein